MIAVAMIVVKGTAVILKSQLAVVKQKKKARNNLTGSVLRWKNIK
jgi:hypothetical protein